ncbi:hypothetical protein JB92DRAFT_2837624 [Gautieria morchelliformis]|nr:hypothetical protein JB92DRAFT_2837624 [Gautieria morchelliformis]
MFLALNLSDLRSLALGLSSVAGLFPNRIRVPPSRRHVQNIHTLPSRARPPTQHQGLYAQAQRAGMETATGLASDFVSHSAPVVGVRGNVRVWICQRDRVAPVNNYAANARKWPCPIYAPADSWRISSQRLRSLEAVQATLLQVESAAGDIEVRCAYETSTMTLKTLLAHPSLNRDKIDETMEALAEAAADHAEIDEAIKLGGEGIAAAAGVTIDEDDMQKELEQMIEEKEKEEAEEREREKEREREREEAKARQEMERQEEAQRRRQMEEEREQKRAIVEKEERQWEERWLAAQAEKAAQAQRDREAENKRRARWEEQERADVQAA